MGAAVAADAARVAVADVVAVVHVAEYAAVVADVPAVDFAADAATVPAIALQRRCLAAVANFRFSFQC